MNREKKAITVALYGLLIALAMVLSFVETMIPIPIPVPGIKLGLANLVTVVGLYLIGIPGTIAVTLIRIVLVGLSFGNPYSMIYGLSGSFLRRPENSPRSASAFLAVLPTISARSPLRQLSSRHQGYFIICHFFWQPDASREH